MKLKQGAKNVLRFAVKNKKPNEQGQVMLNMVYTVDSKPVSRSTGIRIFPSDFDAKTQKVSPKAKDSVRLTRRLEKIKNDFNDVLESFDGRLTADIVGRMMDGTYSAKNDPMKIDFFEYALSYYKDVLWADGKGKLAYSTYYNGCQSIMDVQYYFYGLIGEKFFPISAMNVDMLNKYISSCRNKKRPNTAATINHKLAPIIKAARYAASNDLMKNKVVAAISDSYLSEKTVYESDITPEDKVVRYLTDEQMQDFVDLYHRVKYDTTRDFMDMFLFSFYACGLRVSDIMTLEWGHINVESRMLTKMLVKTKTRISFKLSPAAMEILQKWEGIYPRFVFGRLATDFNVSDPKSLKEEIGRKNRSIVQSLHSIGEKMNLPFNLSMHVARHTFVVKALNEGVPVHKISVLIGDSLMTTEKVYAEFLPKTLDDVIERKLSFEFKPKK